MNWGLFVGVLAFLCVELVLQRWIRQKLLAVSCRFTSKPGCALKLYGFIMLPGTILHEASHMVSALVLGSQISSTSLTPRYVEDEGVIELGSVIAKDVGSLRNSIISIAPLFVGTAIIISVGWLVFDLPTVAVAIEQGTWDQAVQSLAVSFGTVWGWIGAYVILVASMNMLPSSVDIQTAAGLILVFVSLFAGLLVLCLVQNPVLDTAVEIANSSLRWLGIVLAFTILLSVPLFFLLTILTSGRQVKRDK